MDMDYCHFGKNFVEH